MAHIVLVTRESTIAFVIMESSALDVVRTLCTYLGQPINSCTMINEHVKQIILQYNSLLDENVHIYFFTIDFKMVISTLCT